MHCHKDDQPHTPASRAKQLASCRWFSCFRAKKEPYLAANSRVSAARVSYIQAERKIDKDSGEDACIQIYTSQALGWL